MDHYEKMSDILRALAHPLRLQIVETLRRDGEACVCHLEAHLGQRQATISQQLARLREAGLVVDRREGLNIYYSLVDGLPGALLDLARQMEEAVDVAGEARPASRPKIAASPAICPCPKCRQQRSASPATVLDQQGAS